MTNKFKNAQTQRFAENLKKMGMDEDSIEVHALKYDNELTQVEEAKKALDEDMKDDKKANDNDVKDDMKAKDNDMKDDDKKANDDESDIDDMKGMDMNILESVVDKLFTKKMADYEAKCGAKNKAMDEAITAYKKHFGANKVALDSVEGMYDAILAKYNINVDKEHTLDYKKGMVAALGSANKQSFNYTVGDSNTVDDELEEFNKKILNGGK